MPRGFGPRVVACFASRDLIPLYSVYALLFGDSGLSAAQISSLFILWSLTGFVLEVPSGAWADLVDRRRLLVLSALVNGAGFAVWALWPTYPGFALGFVLWGLSGALASGTFESLVYDGLAAHEQAARYPRLIGRAHAAAMTANLVASVSAGPLMALGGYPLVAGVSVAACGVQALLAATLPVADHRPGTGVHEVVVSGERLSVRYVAVLRAGVAEASGSPTVRWAVLIAAAVIGSSTYDEYFPLVARDHGASTEVIPWLVGLVVLGQVVGTALAGRSARMRGPAMGWLLLGAAATISVGALLEPEVGFVAVAVGYGLLNNAMVVSEARVQEVIRGPARATVTSVCGLAVEVVALSVYVAFAVTSGALSVPTQVALLGVPLALVALLCRRRLPDLP